MKLATIILSFTLATPVLGHFSAKDSDLLAKGNDSGTILLAKKGKDKKKKMRKRILNTEARSKKGQRTKIDFDEASIDGRRRDPAGMAITKNRPDHEYDLINLRLRWHPEMIKSTANLETGKGR